MKPPVHQPRRLDRLRDPTRRYPRRREERGSAGIELLLMATASVSLVLVVVAAGRYNDGQAQAGDAAYAAARAASLVPNPAQAVNAGRQAAKGALAERGRAARTSPSPSPAATSLPAAR